MLGVRRTPHVLRAAICHLELFHTWLLLVDAPPTHGLDPAPGVTARGVAEA